jgi:hypothetical protein
MWKKDLIFFWYSPTHHQFNSTGNYICQSLVHSKYGTVFSEQLTYLHKQGVSTSFLAMPAHTYNGFSPVVIAATLRIEDYKRTDSEKILKNI